jgi:hypothetical protein
MDVIKNVSEFSKGQASIYLCFYLCLRLGKHLDELAASASVAWASEPAKNTQVEKRKLFRRRLYCAYSGVEGLPGSPHYKDVI